MWVSMKEAAAILVVVVVVSEIQTRSSLVVKQLVFELVEQLASSSAPMLALPMEVECYQHLYTA